MRITKINWVRSITIFPAMTLAWSENAKTGGQISSFLGNEEYDPNFWHDSDDPDPLIKNDGQLQNGPFLDTPVSSQPQPENEQDLKALVATNKAFTLNKPAEKTNLYYSSKNLSTQEASYHSKKHRRLPGTTGSGYCLNSLSNANLFDTSAFAEQSQYYSGACNTATCGCNGFMIDMNQDFTRAFTEEVDSGVSTTGDPLYWKVTLHQPCIINAILFIDKDFGTSRIQDQFVTFGDLPDVTKNRECVACKTMLKGGWCKCDQQMTGTVFGVYKLTDVLSFMEVMAYTQQALQINPYVTVQIIGNETYPASNALSMTVILGVFKTGNQCVVIEPVQTTSDFRSQFSFVFKAEVWINAVVALGGYETSISSLWPDHQKNIQIYSKTVVGTYQLCGVISNYYNAYEEQSCDIQANEITLLHQDLSKSLRFCGLGVLSDCGCISSSFNPLLFTTTQTPFISQTSLSVTFTDSIQTIYIVEDLPDTVSSVCGNADGLTECGSRYLSFKNKLTGQQIDETNMPYFGYTYHPPTGTASHSVYLDPTKAAAHMVVTVTISLVNYPTVQWSEDVTSTVQGGITVPHTPNAPIITANLYVSATITWTAPISTGIPITAYKIAIKKSDGTFSTEPVNCDGTKSAIILDKMCTIPFSILKAAPFSLKSGSSVVATVIATNGLGDSDVSPVSNGLLIIEPPNTPSPPSTSISSNSLTITWVAPYDGGSAIKAYKVAIGQSDGITFTTETANCNISTTSCTVPISILKAEPYSLNGGSSVYAKVLAINKSGSSSFSNKGNGAVIPRETSIPAQTLTALINQEVILILPSISDVVYTVTSTQTFSTSVNGTKLKVMSANKLDIGIKILKMSAKTQISNEEFIVTVIFKDAVITKNTILQSKVETSNSIVEVKTTAAGSLNTAQEVANDSQSANGQSSSNNLDSASVTLKNGQIQALKAAEIQPPTLKLTKVNNRGEFYLIFSEPMNTEVLKNTTHGYQGLRSLKATKKSSSKKRGEKYSYLLSSDHLRISIQSENSTLPNFSWFASDITPTHIVIQMDFQDPLCISSGEYLDKVEIKILPPALIYFKSLASGLQIDNPLRTQVVNLPRQMFQGATTESAQSASESLGEVGTAITAANVVVQILLSGSMAQMWSMVNSMQIILTYEFLNLPRPGNVIMVMTNLADLCSMAVLPTDDIMSFLFNLTPTDVPGVGFEAMGSDNKSLCLYLGMAFLIMLFIGFQYLLYALSYCCRHYDNLMNKIEEKLRPGLVYGVLYLFLVETYLDWAIGSALRIEEPKYETPSDYFDLGLACIGTMITLVLPFYCFFFLRKNVNYLNEDEFKSRHGALYEGLMVDDEFKQQETRKMVPWFLVRRFFTAVNIVYLRNDTIWIQLTVNMYLSLYDTAFKFSYGHYKNRVGGFMEKFNDLFVITCSYFIYLFTDLTQSQEEQYLIGWVYSGVIGILITSNLFVLIMTAFKDLKEKIKSMIDNCNHQKQVEEQKKRRELQKKVMLKVKSQKAAFDVKAVTELDLQEQLRAFNRILRKNAKQQAINKNKVAQQLKEISEVDENQSEQSEQIGKQGISEKKLLTLHEREIEIEEMTFRQAVQDSQQKPTTAEYTSQILIDVKTKKGQMDFDMILEDLKSRFLKPK